MLGGGVQPARGVFEIELVAVAARAPHRPRLDLLRGGVEDPGWSATAPGLRAGPFQSALQLHRIVASVEDEHAAGLWLGQPSHQGPHLRGGDLVGVLRRLYPPGIDGRNPRVALEAELGHELVGPAGNDGLAGGVAGRVVVVPPLGARLRVAAGPTLTSTA